MNMKKILAGVVGTNVVLSGLVIGKIAFFNNTPEYNSIFTEHVKADKEEKVAEEPTKKVKDNSFTNEELAQVELGRNPFGNSPKVESEYQQREAAYKKQLANLKKAEEEKQKAEAIIKQKEQDASNNTAISQNDYNSDGYSQEQTPSDKVTPDNTKNGVDANGNKISQADTDLTRNQLETMVADTAKKYKVDNTWVLGVMEATSNYDTSLKTNVDNVVRKGIMQINSNKEKFIMESLGIYYDATKVMNAQMNMDMGAWYLNYLSKLNADEDFIFTAYYYGEDYAKNLYKKNGSYKSEFSTTVLNKIKKLN